MYGDSKVFVVQGVRVVVVSLMKKGGAIVEILLDLEGSPKPKDSLKKAVVPSREGEHKRTSIAKMNIEKKPKLKSEFVCVCV